MSYPYIDILGNIWPDDKLSALLADPDVSLTVMSGVSMGLRPDGTWSPAAVLNWAKIRYTREEPAALLLLLVTLYFDTDGRRYLTKEGGR